MTSKTLHAAWVNIQQNLKAPKNRLNKFGNYNYRSCEDILEAVKPLLGECALKITDDIVKVGGRVYVKATASLILGDEAIENTAFAREPDDKKGADQSQITGAASSYARKYALNGLFLIDDTQDADATNNHDDDKSVAPMNKTGNRQVDKWVNNACADLLAATEVEYLKGIFGDFWKAAKEKGCTQDQFDILKYNYDSRKERLERGEQ